MTTRSTGLRMLSAALSFLLTAGVLALLVPGAARADSAPPVPSATTPTTVTADALPTVQINGVAWSQVVVGNTVYVGGQFTTARPAGAAPGTQQVARTHLLAYDIRTGNLITSFAHTLNAQVLTVAASPDGSRVYIGGDFTQVDGQTRNRVAAFDTATGALVANWRPSVSSQVRAIAATNDTVYLGGALTAVGGVSRTRLAAVTAADGSLLPWAPVPGVGSTAGNRDGNTNTSNVVMGLVVTGGGSQVVAAGRFDSLNGVKATGVGALDPVTGATRPFAINQYITNQGVNSAVYSLTTDGTTVFGTGYDFYGPGNFEGSFAAAADGGAVVSINGCHGDTYSSFPLDGVLYLAGHAHQCAPNGSFPEQDPRVNKFATAVSIAPSGTVAPPSLRNNLLVGQPAAVVQPWFPTMSAGTYTGQAQAGWSVSGNSDYVVYGGEFPRVNGTAQQGLVRYAYSDTAPNRIGPKYNPGMTPDAASLSAGTARISWQTTDDDDNQFLTYRVVRNGNTAAPVYEVTSPSTWWNRPVIGFVDRNLTPGATYTYRVYAVDPFGNQTNGGLTSVTVSDAAGGGGLYADTVLADGAQNYWRLDEPAAATAGYDQAGFADLSVGSGVTREVAGALSGSTNTASSFNGTSNGLMATQTAVPGPNTFSVEAWFRTTSTAGGKIIGFGSSPSGISSNRDRHVYMDNAGRVYFGVYTGVRQSVNGPGAYNDGQWHHVVATLSPAGMALYVDGELQQARPEITAGQAYNGYWRIGGDRGWAGADYWTGTVDEVAIYPTALSAGQVANHYSVGSDGAAINVPPTAAFTDSADGLTVTVDGSTSADGDGTITGYAWDFDGTAATGPTATHTFPAAGTYPVTLTVTDDDGATGAVTRELTVTAPPPNQAPTASFTATATDLDVDVDGSASADVDGSIAGWSWDFGDGTTLDETDPVAAHTYAAAGTYTVTLTVTDDDGATATTDQQVEVTAPTGPAMLVEDDFGRTVSGGWGTADVGGAWTAAVGANRQSVAPGVGTLSLPSAGNNTGVYAGDVAATDVELLTTFSVSSMPTGSGTYVYLTPRRVGSGQEYRVRLRLTSAGGIAVALSRLSGGETFPGGEVTLPGVTFTAGAPITARITVSGSGSTDIAATVWRAGTAEPAAPQRTWTDTTAALQADGAVGLAVHRPGNTTAATDVRFSSVRAAAPGGTGGGDEPPPNTPPTAAFDAAVTDLSVAVDASASADPDGSVASYAWNWGDGSPAGSGVTATHAYAAAGTFTVTLTATDDDGATATATRSVTVTAPTVPNQPPSPAFTATPAGLEVAVDAAGTTDADGTVTGYAWNWGDGSPAGSGVTATHAYAAAGTYTVTLTVTDDDGATATTTRTVTVADEGGEPAPVVLAQDAFGRTVSNGLGTADVGGAWTAWQGAARQSVTPGVATFALPAAGNNTVSYLGGVSQTSAEIVTTFSVSSMPTGSGTYVYVGGRFIGTLQAYRVRVRLLSDGRVALALSRYSGGGEQFPGGEVILPGVTFEAGTPLTARIVVTGTDPTTIAATVWRADATEPTAPQRTWTDATAELQVAGGFSLMAHRPGNTTAATEVRFTSFVATVPEP